MIPGRGCTTYKVDTIMLTGIGLSMLMQLEEALEVYYHTICLRGLIDHMFLVTKIMFIY